MTLYPIFMNTLAFRLERMGFKVIKITPNKKKPQFNVYWFEDTLELHDAISALLD
jgi:hypothetical protein